MLASDDKNFKHFWVKICQILLIVKNWQKYKLLKLVSKDTVSSKFAMIGQSGFRRKDCDVKSQQQNVI